MAIIILLICLGLQRIALVDQYAYQLQWLEYYFQWLNARIEKITQGHPLTAVLVLVLPVVIVVSLIFTFIYHFLGVVAYAVLNLILLWLCLDGRNLVKKPYFNAGAPQLFVLTYQRLFAVIFWFVIFGPAGLILYTTTVSLRIWLTAENNAELLVYAMKLEGCLDWVPLRLVGLSYALMGQFANVFQTWLPQLWNGIQNDQQAVAYWGLAAVTEPSNEEAIRLIDRTLLLWISIIALFTIAFWLG